MCGTAEFGTIEFADDKPTGRLGIGGNSALVMSGRGNKIQWIEPWRWEDAKVRMREVLHELPSWKRMLVYCIGLPCAAYGGVALFVPMETLEESLPWGFWGQLLLAVAACGLFFWALPVINAASPRTMVIREKVMVIDQGQSVRAIKVEQVEAIAFTGDASERKMLVEFQRKQGGTSAVSVRLSPKVAEPEIAAFLFEQGLAHLCQAEQTLKT